MFAETELTLDYSHQATTQLNTQYYKKSTCIPALYEISATSSNQAVSA